jgi:hypothetical protein
MTGESKLLEGLVERWVAIAKAIEEGSPDAGNWMRRNTFILASVELKALIPQAVAAAKLEEMRRVHKQWEDKHEVGEHKAGVMPHVCLFCRRIAELERLAAASGDREAPDGR